MIDKKYYEIIRNDLSKDFHYEIKEWWDYYVILVDNILAYRFSKEDIDLEEIEKEKKILDILNVYITIDIPKFEIIWGVCSKYKLIKWDTMEKLDITNLAKKDIDDMLNDIVSFLKELHSIPSSNFNFLETENWNYDIYRNNFKNEMDIRLSWKVEVEKIEKLKQYIHDLFELDFKEKVLVHTDVQWKNIIFDYENNNISWIIDFTGCRLSGREQDFIHFLDLGEDIFRTIIIKYLWTYDENFVNTVKFLHKKPLIFEIMNDEIYNNDFETLLTKINNF